MAELTSVHDADSTVNTAALRAAFGRFPSGVTAMCALGDYGGPVGIAASSFVSVSLDRFEGLSWHATDEGAVLLHGATAWLDCSIESAVPAGDHVLVLFRVHRQSVHPEHDPLTGLEKAS
ncbi:flavin reductase family protein [Amycolatopsis acidicola]|uniref:Flavin reductase family protein n=1 Tax=Amycolatopsis acidicola TaxID=2596893 RepID=A0A5N0UNF6_9PSEU|nr:flavin reductase family protein [Amycolatopsis acidicola]KAA9148131.1 flavin reductase family protein [Amycolatopsis acidicola]